MLLTFLGCYSCLCLSVLYLFPGVIQSFLLGRVADDLCLKNSKYESWMNVVNVVHDVYSEESESQCVTCVTQSCSKKL